MKRSFSEGRCIDYPDIGEEDEDILRKVNSEDKSLDSIVRMAQQEMLNNHQVQIFIITLIIFFYFYKDILQSQPFL